MCKHLQKCCFWGSSLPLRRSNFPTGRAYPLRMGGPRMKDAGTLAERFHFWGRTVVMRVTFPARPPLTSPRASLPCAVSFPASTPHPFLLLSSCRGAGQLF